MKNKFSTVFFLAVFVLVGTFLFGFNPQNANATTPTVTGVTSDHANGSFKAGEVINIQITFFIIMKGSL